MSFNRKINTPIRYCFQIVVSVVLITIQLFIYYLLYFSINRDKKQGFSEKIAEKVRKGIDFL